jgi:formylglycine-generating enzyme required for sulfatase activity
MKSDSHNFGDEAVKRWLTSLLLLGLLCADCAWAQSGRFFRISGPAQTHISSMKSDGVATWTNAQSGAVYTFQVSSAGTEAANWVDYLNVIGTAGANTNRLFDLHPPTDMAFIPAGSFTMGDSLDGDATALPLHTVHASAIHMDQFDVTKALWDSVYQWAFTNGYTFDNGGMANGLDHPVQMVNWYDCVKWCNARSEMNGKPVAYYTDSGLRTPYRSGEVEPYVNWTSGYRLPTEAEWERAARGGLNGQRYPWGNTINESQANYNNPDETTTPVTQYPPNGYGLYDMSGNMWQWCWDWYGSYDGATQTDPHGPPTGTRRVNRGGGMVSSDYQLRTAARTSDLPTFRDNYVGFRCVLPLGR